MPPTPPERPQLIITGFGLPPTRHPPTFARSTPFVAKRKRQSPQSFRQLVGGSLGRHQQGFAAIKNLNNAWRMAMSTPHRFRRVYHAWYNFKGIGSEKHNKSKRMQTFLCSTSIDAQGSCRTQRNTFKYFVFMSYQLTPSFQDSTKHHLTTCTLSSSQRKSVEKD